MTDQETLAPPPRTDHEPHEIPPPVALLHILSGMMTARMVQVAARLGLADMVTDSPRTSAELAAEAGTHAPTLYRLLRGLASIGIFVEDEEGRFSHTPLSTFLRSDVQGSMRDLAQMWGDDWRWNTWRELDYSIETGEKGFDHLYGTSLWEYFANDNHAAGELFGRAMTSFSEGVNMPIVSSYDFSSAGKLVDIGGAHGGFLRHILTAYPNLTATLFDLPSVIETVREQSIEPELRDRYTLVAGDFMESAPSGGDTYLMKFILHDWDDEHCIRILRNVRNAMHDGARLLIVEMVIPEANVPFFGKILDMEMLVVLGGRERTEEEFRRLLEASGFRLDRIVPTPSPFSVIEGIPV